MHSRDLCVYFSTLYYIYLILIAFCGESTCDDTLMRVWATEWVVKRDIGAYLIKVVDQSI